MKNFSIFEKLKKNIMDVEKHDKYTANYLFNFLGLITFCLVMHRVIRKPVEWYYQFDDPF